ncbi:DUF6415 family natural product biosynthesis protein [Streptomyces sp. NPDC050560]|uniref:DUF6415 family natural product biosynthesis protein n=1 Tax=Streptomyces sp. NPDC050560 TaxID=3365630 RepID=UPI0037A030A7
MPHHIHVPGPPAAAAPADHPHPPAHTPPPLPPDVAAMRADAADVLDDDTPPFCAQEHALTVSRMRACLLLLAPRVAHTARLLPEGGRRTAALVAVAEAWKVLGADSHPDTTGPGARTPCPRRLAATVELLCRQYERLCTAFWTPPVAPGPTLVAAGEHWDAVRVAHPLGAGALGRLGPDTGAVLEDRSSRVLYWLVERGRADAWRLPPAYVRVLGTGTYVAVPPAHHTEGRRVRWRVPCAPPVCLTRPARLHEALTAELATAPGPTPADTPGPRPRESGATGPAVRTGREGPRGRTAHTSQEKH